MVYLLKMVIFHGYVSHKQMIIPVVISIIPEFISDVIFVALFL